MSLLFIAAGFPPKVGGIQTYVAELCRALAKRGEELTVIATQQPGSRAFDDAVPYPVVRVASRDLLSTALAMNTAAVNVTPRPEAVIATKWSPEGVAAILARKRLAVPYVVMGYGREFIQTGGNVMKWAVQRAVLRRAAGGLAISDYTGRLMPRRGLPADKVHVIYAGVRPEAYTDGARSVPELRSHLGLTDEKVILTVSRLVARKGQDVVMRALAQVRMAVPRLRYIIVGDGPRREELEAVAEELGVQELVSFVGEVPGEQLSAYYHLCDVFVMTSRDVAGEPSEGFGLVYLEANACGKPVIGGCTGGVEDAIAEGVSGLLVDPENPDEIARALTRILSDQPFAQQLGQQGRRRIEDGFTWDHVAERFQGALGELGIRAE